MNTPPSCKAPDRPTDIWISVSMVGVLISIVVGILTINRTLTEAAISQEARFIRLEEQVKSLKEDIQEYKELRQNDPF